jgi:hypothetical protein
MPLGRTVLCGTAKLAAPLPERVLAVLEFQMLLSSSLVIILAGPMVLSAVGACPPHDGVG